jgi:hypothetical protein
MDCLRDSFGSLMTDRASRDVLGAELLEEPSVNLSRFVRAFELDTLLLQSPQLLRHLVLHNRPMPLQQVHQGLEIERLGQHALLQLRSVACPHRCLGRELRLFTAPSATN